MDMADDHVVDLVLPHAESIEFVRQGSGDAEPSSERRVGRTDPGVHQDQARRGSNQETVVAEVPGIGGELARVALRERPPSARRDVPWPVEKLREGDRGVDVEDRGDLDAPNG